MPENFAGPSIEQIEQAMRESWMAGDFGVVARTISGSAEAFVQRLSLAPGAHVLDVACGTGNVAVPLSRAGCVVTGVDIAPNLLEQARARAKAESLSISFDEGDAERLPYANAAFDAVVTMFGAMFAPRPALVAREFARVLKPGGRLAMANWNPESFSGAMFRVNARHVPSPPGVQPPVLWGEERHVRERLAADFEQIECRIIPVDFDLATNPAGAVAFFRQYFGPTQLAFRRLNDQGQAAFARDLESLWTRANIATDPESHTLVRNEYLEVRALSRR